MPKKTTKLKHRKGAWFAPVRGSYIPVSWKGWLTYIPFVVYLVYSMYVANAYTGNNWKAVLWIVPNWVAAAVVLTWVAKATS
jgi:hypothetical protein